MFSTERDNSFGFRKDERIRKRADISEVFKKGRHWSTKGLRLNVLPNGTSTTRAIFVTRRKYGNAVQRNRARRVVSESWRLQKSRVADGLDVVIVIYPEIDTFENRDSQLKTLLSKASILEV